MIFVRRIKVGIYLCSDNVNHMNFVSYLLKSLAKPKIMNIFTSIKVIFHGTECLFIQIPPPRSNYRQRDIRIRLHGRAVSPPHPEGD